MTGFTLKVVVRCRNLDESSRFWGELLDLHAEEAWDGEEGRGCIFDVRGGKLEIAEMRESDPRFEPSLRQAVVNDKIDLQLETSELDAWIARIGGQWPFEGPEILPWGQRWIKLRDPDGLLVAIWQWL